jgi:exosortase H (IPTLxxWG-CTERM-specific)
VAEGAGATSPAAWSGVNRPILVFLLSFGLWIGLFSILFQLSWIDQHAVLPMTEATARVSNIFIRGLGFDTQVNGTVIAGSNGFAVNILKGCNGAYVLAIYLSAVFGFPSSFREKAMGAGIGIPVVQIINIGRIVSLYYIGAKFPDLFESFHYHVWQTIVIVLAMAVWIAWAELLVKNPGR